MTNNFALFIFNKLQSNGGCNDLHGFTDTFNNAVKIATLAIQKDREKVAQILDYSTGKISLLNIDIIDNQKPKLPVYVKVVRVRTVEYKNKDYHQNVLDDNILYNIGESLELSLCVQCELIIDRSLFTNHYFICNKCFFR